MTRVTRLIHNAGKYQPIFIYPLPTHPTHNFTHKNCGNLDTLPDWPKKFNHNRPARCAGQQEHGHDSIGMQIPLYLSVLTHCSAIGGRSIDYRVVLDCCLIVSFNLVEQITLFKWPMRTHESRNTAIFLTPSLTTISLLHYPRDLSRYAPSPWEASLYCNDVSHWLGAYLDWSLREYPSIGHVDRHCVLTL